MESSTTAKIIFILTSFTFITSHMASIKACPVSCDCHVTNFTSHVTCINQSLTSIPDNIPENVTHLYLRGNRISSLTTVFQRFKQIQKLDLSFNLLTKIQASAFNTNFFLEELDLSSNNISSIEEQTFANLPKLSVLNLANNSISSLNGAIFSGLLGLQKLYLQHNDISVLSKDSFCGTETLAELDLSSNSIREIPGKAFRNLENLTILNIQYNLLTDFDGSGIFPRESFLQSLDLSNNELSICVNLTFPYLRFLNLSWNKLESFQEDIFLQTENLTTLILDGNPIHLVRKAIFETLGYLNQLSMSYMPNLTYLSKESFRGLSNLEVLTMHNDPSLSFIHKELFLPLRSIKLLDLSNNAIETIYNSTIPDISTGLSSLNLQGNVFKCDCATEWMIMDINSNNSIIQNPKSLQCHVPLSNVTKLLSGYDLDLLQCSDVLIVNHSSDSYFKIGRSAILKCEAMSGPSPEIIWITPRNHVLKYHDFHPLAVQDYLPLNDKDAHKLYHSSHEWHEQPSYYSDSQLRDDRIVILEDGSLYIDYVMRSDGGPYKCIAKNPRNSSEVTITLYLDYNVLTEVKIWSFIVGFGCAGSFFLLNLTYSLTLAAIRRCVSQRRRERIHQIVEAMDQYKTAQLTRIKENYNHQVGRIRDQYHYQLGRIREHHHNQMARMGKMREGASQRVDKLKENYNNQLGRLKEYSSSQLVQLREKYNSQVDKIKDYGSDKFERIHEKYKLKQQHVIKLLDMMNLDKCRTAFDSECVRTESMILQSDVFTSEAPLHSPIDSVSVSDSEYMTATSTESSKYSSQHNISRNVDDEDSDEALSPMNPYIPEDPLANISKLENAQNMETSFMNEACGITIQPKDEDHLKELPLPTSLPSTSNSFKTHKQSSRNRQKHRNRHNDKGCKNEEETQRLYASDCDSVIDRANKAQDFSDIFDEWSIFGDLDLASSKARSDTHIHSKLTDKEETKSYSPSGSVMSGRSSSSSRDRPLSLNISRCYSEKQRPISEQTRVKGGNKTKDQVTIDMTDTDEALKGLLVKESIV